jgi:hypothetical protein
MKRVAVLLSLVAVLALIVAIGTYEYNSPAHGSALVADGGGNPPPPKGSPGPLPWPPSSLAILGIGV